MAGQIDVLNNAVSDSIFICLEWNQESISSFVVGFDKIVYERIFVFLIDGIIKWRHEQMTVVCRKKEKLKGKK